VTIRGRTALVTGGGRGIGLASAARLAADGAHVAICGRTEEKLAKAEAAIAPGVGDGGSIRSIVADVTIEPTTRCCSSREGWPWAG
jgi:NAD(P)-dependent dehydrogenase (short-subunit alcohol dehydrogenase family)